MGIVEQYLLQLNIEKRRLRRAAAILTVLSLLVAVGVSWNLRMTGITLVNDACCGYTEHLHTEECLAQNTVSDHDEEGLPHTPADECCQNDYQCGYDEHLHSLACYSNPKADVETLLDWQQAFETYPYSGDLREDLVGIAKTQVGYTESALNFEADNDGERHGYTRYGAWYGAPYTEWSAMFVSFCLHYAGANLNEYPISSGADTMAGLWDHQKKYTPAGQYSPVRGDLAFFDDNTVGIVAEVQSTTMYIICGDMHDAVSGSIMSVSDDCITGWGVIDKTVADDPVTDAFIEENRTFTLSVGNARSVNDLAVYLQGNGGTYHYTLTNAKNENLDPDDNKHYDVTINEGYKLVLSIDSPNGIESGTYRLQLPHGLLYDDGTGEIIIKNGSDESQWVSVGTWEVSGDGLVTIVFNE
ncbi:MAG: hypothetical protein IIU58_06350, partial [Clostridia bacterium]|nr:hypothetical protein [Clostridia bacterium]